jgi:hypothetical protein
LETRPCQRLHAGNWLHAGNSFTGFSFRDLSIFSALAEYPLQFTAQQVAACTDFIGCAIASIMVDDGFAYDISPKRLRNAVVHFLKDMERIDLQRRGSVSVAKFSGYIGFWIRKIKPIRLAYPQEGTSDSEIETYEVADINERMAIKLALYIMTYFRSSAAEPVFEDPIFLACNDKREKAGMAKCEGLECLRAYTSQYLSFRDQEYFNYLIYSMRFSTFGPHNLVAILDNLLMGACAAFGNNHGDSGSR